MSNGIKKDPRQGNKGSLKKWLADPKNREKMYLHDRDALADLTQDDEGHRNDYNVNTSKPQQNGEE